MPYTDLNLALDNGYVNKLDLMINRCNQAHPVRDTLLIIEGGEGEGKTSSAVGTAYYAKYKTGRDIHLFFKLKDMASFVKNTEKKIIIWDEPSLDALNTDWYNGANKDLIRLLMNCRKKQHFLIFNFTKFDKFSPYIVVERAIALVHMYSRNEIEAGRFVYIRRRNLEELYNKYRASKKRFYKQLSSIRGSFPDVMKPELFNKMKIYVNNIPNATMEIYNQEKDKGILSIGESKEADTKDNKYEKELKELKYKCSQVKPPIKSRDEYASKLKISVRTLQTWAHAYKNHEDSVEKPQNEAEPEIQL